MTVPTVDEFDAMPFVEQVATLTAIVGVLLEGFKHHLAVRQRDGRELSGADRKALLAIEMSIRCLLVESRERLEPGSLDAAVRDAYAALAATQEDGRA